MKKLLIIALGVIVLGVTSCEKCQTCNTRTVQSYGGYDQTTNTSENYCGDDYDDAPGDHQTIQNQGGVTQTVTITCTED